MLFFITLIQSALLLIAAFLIIIASIGILKLDKNMDNVLYVRIHILGIVDIACVLAFIGLNQPLFAGVYFVLAPFIAHAISNAYCHSEDKLNTGFNFSKENEKINSNLPHNEYKNRDSKSGKNNLKTIDNLNLIEEEV